MINGKTYVINIDWFSRSVNKAEKTYIDCVTVVNIGVVVAVVVVVVVVVAQSLINTGVALYFQNTLVDLVSPCSYAGSF